VKNLEKKISLKKLKIVSKYYKAINNSKFILSLKTKLPAPETILLLNPPFQNFFNTQRIHQNIPPQNYINDQLPHLQNINDLDNLLSTIIMYNLYQAIDE